MVYFTVTVICYHGSRLSALTRKFVNEISDDPDLIVFNAVPGDLNIHGVFSLAFVE